MDRIDWYKPIALLLWWSLALKNVVKSMLVSLLLPLSDVDLNLLDESLFWCSGFQREMHGSCSMVEVHHCTCSSWNLHYYFVNGSTGSVFLLLLILFVVDLGSYGC